MARWWSETLDPERHRDFMSTTHVGGFPLNPVDRLVSRQVFFVQAAGFTFQFVDLGQLREALAHFRQRVHPSSREAGIDLEHNWQRWYERLPQWLFAEPRRVRVVAGLSRALAAFEAAETKARRTNRCTRRRLRAAAAGELCRSARRDRNGTRTPRATTRTAGRRSETARTTCDGTPSRS